MVFIARCSSDAPDIRTLLAKIASFEKKEKTSLQILFPGAVYSPLCIKAALEISREKNSLLTALALTQNFSSALRIAGAKDAKDFVLVAWNKDGKKLPAWGRISSALRLKKRAWGKKNAASFAEICGISMEALGLYPLENLIIEKMALAKL